MMNNYITVEEIKYEVRRNSRRKRVSMGLDGDNTFFVAAPAHMPQEELVRILRENSASFIERVAKKRPHLLTEGHKYEDGELFYFRGRQYPLRIERGFADGGLRFTGEEFLAGQFAEPEILCHSFEAWYAHRLRELLQAEFPLWCKRIGVGPKKVSLKNIKTLWGSCSSSRSITFSVRLALMPSPLMEYVMIHELCHLLEMSHSEKFWAHVGRFCSDYSVRRNELKREGDKYRW